MAKLTKILFAACLALSLGSCGKKEEIDPLYVGRTTLEIQILDDFFAHRPEWTKEEGFEVIDVCVLGFGTSSMKGSVKLHKAGVNESYDVKVYYRFVGNELVYSDIE